MQARFLPARDPLCSARKFADFTLQKFYGILTRKERWGLSCPGWLLVALIGLATLYLSFLCVHPFLAVTRRVDTKILVVEGWVPDSAIRAAAEEFKTGAYERIFVTGGPREGFGSYIPGSDTAATFNADWLQYKGVPSEFLQAVPLHVIGRDRTYNSAVALRNWFREHNMPVHAINVLTQTAHARRTRLLFAKAFGDHVTIGIIAAPNPDYDPKRWWRYSDGVREVVGEAVAYMYARLFFYPAPTES